jgi:hypothetical protein
MVCGEPEAVTDDDRVFKALADPTRRFLLDLLFACDGPEKIWQAITEPEWNGRYGYAAPQFFELRPGGSYRSTARCSRSTRRASWCRPSGCR